MKPTTTGKRVVSRAAFVGIQFRLIMAGVFWLILLAFCLALGVFTFIASCLTVWGYSPEAINRGWAGVGFLLTISFAFLLCVAGEKTKSSSTKLAKMPSYYTVNAAGLPASESLVRASIEPAQPQETFLLRAVTPGHTTPAEQLLRPDNVCLP